MGDGTEQNPYTREDVLKLIEENGGTAEELDLSDKTFAPGIDLSKLDLKGIVLNGTTFPPGNVGAILSHAHLEGAEFINARLEGAASPQSSPGSLPHAPGDSESAGTTDRPARRRPVVRRPVEQSRCQTERSPH